MDGSYTEKQVMEIAGKHGFVKVNLPPTLEDYRRGNGEGVFAVIPECADRIKYQDNSGSGQFIAVLCNDSVYYPHMKYGMNLLCEFRGKNRAVACWDDLSDSKEAVKNRMRTLDQLRTGGANSG